MSIIAVYCGFGLITLGVMRRYIIPGDKYAGVGAMIIALWWLAIVLVLIDGVRLSIRILPRVPVWSYGWIVMAYRFFDNGFRREPVKGEDL